MNRVNLTLLLMAFLRFVVASEVAIKPTDLVAFREHIQPFFAEHCVSCRGEKKRKAKFALHDIDGSVTSGKDIVRWEKILEMISLGEMPPEDEPQPALSDLQPTGSPNARKSAHVIATCRGNAE